MLPMCPLDQTAQPTFKRFRRGVRDWFVAVQRGSKPLPPDFRLDDLLRMRGAELSLI